MSAGSCRRVDVVVAGGGPAGSATARCLAREGMSVLLIERSTYGSQRVGETFPPAMQWVLARLGLWESFCKLGAVPAPGMRCVWGSDEAYERDFIFDPYGCGWHVDRQGFDAFLAQATEAEGVCVLRGARIDRIERTERPPGGAGWAVNIAAASGPLGVEAQFLVDATGRVAALGRHLGARRVAHDRLVGLYAFATGSAADGSTLIEATENGWWYSAALPASRSVFAFMTDADLCARGRFCSAAGWRSQLEVAVHTRERAGSLSFDDGLLVLSANSSMLAPLGGPGWLAVGDAALAFDPLAGQGAYRALLTATDVAPALRGSRGDGQALAAYAHSTTRDFDRFLVDRSRHYEQEQRWPGSVFWRRRSPSAAARPMAALQSSPEQAQRHHGADDEQRAGHLHRRDRLTEQPPGHQ